jgi:Ca2+-binding RTX toxin-like protein
VYGQTGNDTLFGGAGNDWLEGGDDTLKGGADTDLLLGGDGQDMIYGEDGNDTVGGQNDDDQVWGGKGNDLLFGDGGNDSLYGEADNDTLEGQAGNDSLYGGAGSDTYKFLRGGGMDIIQEDYDATPGNTDLLQFLFDINANQLWFRQAGNNLEVSVIGTADKVTMNNWYLGSGYHVEQVRSGDNKLLLDTKVQNLVQAMAAFAPPPMGQTNLTAAQQAALAPVLAANWQ